MATELSAIILVIAATLVGAAGPILMKKASAKVTFHVMTWIKNPYLIIGGCLFVLSTVMFILALRGGEVSVLYPFVSLTYVWVCFLSQKFLGEHMNTKKWLGIAFIILGVSLIGLGS